MADGARGVAGRAYGRARTMAGAGVRSGRSLARRVIPERRIDGIPRRTLDARRLDLAGRRTFGPPDLADLERLLASADTVAPIREVFARSGDWPARFIALRHDMDNDLENSVRFAEWEAERGIRSTYFVLHTDWYWGRRVGKPAAFTLKALDRIASLGHEIGIHNNALTVALRRGGDPLEILAAEISALRRHGFDIVGSVAHGDPLCRTLGYVNSEMFAEMPRPSLGAPDRTLVHEDPSTGWRAEVRLRPVPMATLGLEYEANLAYEAYEAMGTGRIVRLSDAGGHWSEPFGPIPAWLERDGGYLQILTHPVWWALAGEPYQPRPSVRHAAVDRVPAGRPGDGE